MTKCMNVILIDQMDGTSMIVMLLVVLVILVAVIAGPKLVSAITLDIVIKNDKKAEATRNEKAKN